MKRKRIRRQEAAKAIGRLNIISIEKIGGYKIIGTFCLAAVSNNQRVVFAPNRIQWRQR